MKKVNRLRVTHTKVQWGKINTALSHQGTKNLSAHINKELVRIGLATESVDDISDCATCGQKQQKIFWLNDSSKAIIEKIKQKTGMDAGDIISNFVINPLLLKKII